ncbi:MAG: YebC/PmpR family DNA-binding transcriptional regulator [Succinivibrionaceae bacterium]
MSGHSKWHNIQHRKGLQDAKRGKIFTKLIREITTAARLGGGDPNANPRLRAAIASALSQNMTRDTVNRAIDRGTGGGEGADLETIVYEGYGPCGSAFMVECMTDNRNRTVSDVRHGFTKFGGNLGTSGSVAYLFTKKGLIEFEQGDEDQIMEIALEAGADDVVTNDDGSIEIYTTPETFGTVLDAFEAAGLKHSNAQVTQIASTDAEIDKDHAETFMKLVDYLEDLDDVQEVYHNGNLSDEAVASLDK